MVLAGASSRGSQEGTPLHTLCLGCELSSSIRAEMGWTGPGWTPICMAAPPLAESGGEKEAWGSPASLWGPGSCEHHGLHSSPLVFLSHCSGRAGPQARAQVPASSAPGVQTLGTIPAVPAPYPLCLCLQVPSPSLC